MAERDLAYDNGVLRITQTAASSRLALTGEIDEATYPALVTSLHELAEGQEMLQLDLSGVSYCDLAGLRAIVRLAVQRGRRPRAPRPAAQRAAVHPRGPGHHRLGRAPGTSPGTVAGVSLARLLPAVTGAAGHDAPRRRAGASPAG